MENLSELLLIVLLACAGLLAQTENAAPDVVQKARKTTYCELARYPGANNHELVQLTAFVTHGFEDFHLAEPNCANAAPHFNLWVMYGGKAQSNTKYCCPGESGRDKRSEPLTVEGVQVPLVEDLKFKQFTDILKMEPDTTVHVTVVGRFFSGEKGGIAGPESWRGLGHMGCCSLFVIQRVEWFEPHTRRDLDYTAEAGYYESEGCTWGSVRDLRHVSLPYSHGTAEEAIAEQKAADSGQASWAFSDPQQVAINSLKTFYPNLPVLRRGRSTASRQVFHWKNGKTSVTVVVTRPYWLAFYAKTSSVVWVSTMIKEARCR
jgi:hypothetical protein